MPATLSIEALSRGQTGQALALMDRVFIAPTGRRPSIARRYPALVVHGGAAYWVIRDGDRVVSCLVTRVRSWIDGQDTRQIGMIGGVCTDPSYRGQGLATQLLEQAEQALRSQGVETMALWTSQPAFYARLKWSVEDESVLGELAGAAHPVSRSVGLPGVWIGAPTDAFRFLEGLRARSLERRMVRRSWDYAAMPLPVSRVEAMIVAAPEGEIYALVGVRGDRGYVYEAGGAPSGYPRLWDALRARYALLSVNALRGSDEARWLSDHTPITWEDKPLAMWRGDDPIHVPYFDHI